MNREYVLVLFEYPLDQDGFPGGHFVDDDMDCTVN